jgi:pyrroline-5-carboxylate reductase
MPWADTGAPTLAGDAPAPGSFGIVGFGRMAQALLLPLISDGVIAPGAVRAAVASEASVRHLTEAHGLAVSTNPEAAWGCSTVLLAVKPQQLEAVAAAERIPLQHEAMSATSGTDTDVIFWTRGGIASAAGAFRCF